MLAHSTDAGVREKAMFLAVLFNDQDVVKSLRGLLADRSAATAARLNALQALAYRKDPALVPVLQGLLEEKPLRACRIAIVGQL